MLNLVSPSLLVRKQANFYSLVSVTSTAMLVHRVLQELGQIFIRNGDRHEAERVHGVRYTTFVGDGDSSVYPPSRN